MGASAWNPPYTVTRNPNARHNLAPSLSSTIDNRLASETLSSPSLISSKSVDFLIVTYSGTHVRCSAPTPLDKDEWLAALHAGLEGNIMENRVETLMVLSKLQKDRTMKFSRQYQSIGSNNETRKSCRRLRSCTKSDMMVQSAVASAMTAFQAEIAFCPFVPPLPRVNSVRYDQKINISSTHSEEDSSTPTKCLPSTTGYHSPCDDWSAPLSDTHCTACGHYPPEHAMRIDAAPLPEYGMEVRVDLCHDCWIAQGVLQHVRYLGWLYEVESRDRAAIRMAWDEVKEVMDRIEWENAGLKSEGPEDQTQYHGMQLKNGVQLSLLF